MSIVHFLNVNEGACNIIEHNSGRLSVIDVCCARKGVSKLEEQSEESVLYSDCIKGNFNQKKYPENPIRYLIQIVKIKTIFRYIQTHPDMDHMDGLKDLFETFKVYNFWDTNNTKSLDFQKKTKYREEDWKYYNSLKKSKVLPKTLFLDDTSEGKYYLDENDSDGLIILSPSKFLIQKANSEEKFNQLSYVVLYITSTNRKILFTGDSDKYTWDYILSNTENKQLLKKIDVLIAPHHGRQTGGNDNYLETLEPKLTLFGNADSQYLDYQTYSNKGLLTITTNQANNIILDISDEIDIYVKYKIYAEKAYNSKKYSPNKEFIYRKDYDAYYIGTI